MEIKIVEVTSQTHIGPDIPRTADLFAIAEFKNEACIPDASEMHITRRLTDHGGVHSYFLSSSAKSCSSSIVRPVKKKYLIDSVPFTHNFYQMVVVNQVEKIII